MLMAEELVLVFFNNWYCENSLPLEIISIVINLSCPDFGKLYTLLQAPRSKC
jgi:hypothetical protein